MKYWNKQKKYREQWTKIKHTTPFMHTSYASIKHWCQQQRSSYKFFFNVQNGTWYFENREDAMLFVLIWQH